MKSRYEYVIIGAGVSGLFTAYHLAQRGIHDIIVIEKNYPAAGGTGRCAGGARAQWATEENITLVKNSIPIWKRLTDEIGFNIWFRQGGYLIMAHNEKQAELLVKGVKIQRRLGWKTKIIEDPEEVKRIAPWVNPYDMTLATFNPKDSVIFPFAPAWGLWRFLREQNITLLKGEGVTGLKAEGNRVVKVVTEKRTIEADVVISAAGTHNREILETVGGEWPTKREKHQIIVTLPYKFFFNPLIISFKHSFYMTQTMRGELVLGIGKIEGDHETFLPTAEFLYEVARALVDLMPSLRKVKIMRHWAGHYDVSPDGKPIADRVGNFENLYVIGAGSGHGFMVSPYLTKLFADYIIRGRKEFPLNKLGFDRFKSKKLEPEPFVVG